MWFQNGKDNLGLRINKRVGEAVSAAKLTKETVLAIRADTRSNAQVAKIYGVTAGCISAIRIRRSWRHI